MIRVGIYSQSLADIGQLESHIQDYVIANKLTSKISSFKDEDTFMTTPGSYDIYIMDMDSDDNVYKLGQYKREIDPGCWFIYICSDEAQAHKATKARANYFLTKPVQEEELHEVLGEIRKKIKSQCVIVPTISGDRRIYIDNINYIDIVKRCICYHLCDGALFDGQTLRGAFEKAIKPLDEHESFIFMRPSLLINKEHIQTVDLDNLIFDNGEQIFFPRKQYEMIYNKWSEKAIIIHG